MVENSATPAFGDEEAHGLLQAGAAPSRPWKALRALRVVALAACGACLGGAAVLKARPRSVSGGPETGPPSPALLPQALWEVEAGSDEPHIKPPPASHMMAIGEESCNPKDCMEGDELLDPDQAKAVKARRLFDQNATFGPHARSLQTYHPHNGVFKMWPGGVVKYAWEEGIDAKAKEALEKAMVQWSAKTCIVFQETGLGDGKGVVKFTSSKGGCFASVGYSDHWPHELNLGDGCRVVGIALHELGHTVGMRHEHARPEALEFISFQLSNAEDWWRQWLKTYHDAGDMSAGLPYDMGSIMHYGAWAGALSHGSQDSKTITVKKQDVFGNCQVGQREYLSEGDIVTLNRWYGCPDRFCADLHGGCSHWADIGECSKNPGWMKPNCPHSCGVCQCSDVEEWREQCPDWAKAGYCARGHQGTPQNKEFMHTNCRRSCGDCMVEDVNNCKDATMWGDKDGCSKHKNGKDHRGQPWCKDSWFANTCPQSCDLCPHKPWCW